jgi:hypothetical protein
MIRLIKHVASGQTFQNRKEAKEALGLGKWAYNAKMRDGEIIRITIDTKAHRPHGYESARNTK